jgi:hypothetical protein
MNESHGNKERALDVDRVMTVGAHAVAAQTDVDTVVHNLQSGQSYRLNDIGTRIWELLEAGTTIRAIVRSIGADYAMPADVPPGQVEQDVKALVAALSEYGLVDVVAETGGGAT